jgi:hypothetical protein
MQVRNQLIKQLTQSQRRHTLHQVILVQNLHKVLYESTPPHQLLVVVVLVGLVLAQVFQLEVVHVLLGLGEQQFGCRVGED